MKIKRRVIRAIAVSVVCILLAATLLFIGVAADTIELVAQSSGNYGLSTTPYNNYVYPLGSNLFVYSNSYIVYLQEGSTVKSAFDIRSSDRYSESYLSDNISFYYDGVTLYGLTTRKSSTASTILRLCLYTFTIVDNEIVAASASNSSFTIGSGDHYSPFTSFVNVDGIFYSFYFYKSTDTTSSFSVGFFKWSLGTSISYYSFEGGVLSISPYYSSVSFQNGNCILGLFKYSKVFLFNIYSNSFSSVTPPFYSLSGQNYVFDYEGDTYYVNSTALCKWNIDTVSFDRVGSGVSGVYFSANNGFLTSYSLPASLSVSYTVYSGLPVSDIQILSADSSGINLLDSIPREGLTSLSAFLGSTDNTSALKATYQDGTVLDFTFDQRFDGYAFGDDVPGSQVYPPVRNVWVDIPIDGLTSNLFLLGDYTNGYVTVVDEGWGALVRLNYISPDNYIEFQFFEDSYRITTYSSDGSILYSKYEQESVKRWRLQVDSVWREWTVYDSELTDYFEIRSTDGVDAVMLDFTYVDSGGGDTSGDESDPETSVPDYSDPLWNGLFSGDPLEESKQNDANSRFNDFNSKAQAEQSLAGDIGGMIPDYSLQVDYAGDIQDQVDKWGSRSDGATSAKDMSNWLWSSLGCGAMFSVVMGGVLIRFILQTRA